MNALAMRAAPQPRYNPWIISAGQDLVWFQGSVLAGVALLVFFAVAPPLSSAGGATQPALLALLLWGILFDGTHVVGTYARSYLAPDPRARAGLPGPWSWSLLALGPRRRRARRALGRRRRAGRGRGSGGRPSRRRPGGPSPAARWSSPGAG